MYMKAIITLIGLKNAEPEMVNTLHNFVNHFARVYGLNVLESWSAWGKNNIAFYNVLVDGWKLHYLNSLLKRIGKRFKGCVGVHVRLL